MDPGLVIISMFVCITAAIKYIVDAITRRKILSSHASEDMVRAILQADEQSRRVSSLKWGLALLALGLAAGAIEFLKIELESPAAIGILFTAVGVALLVFHWLSAKSGARS